jgi:hypothetical protein
MKIMTAWLVFAFITGGCVNQNSFEDGLVGNERTAFETCKAEIEEAFEENYITMNVPNPEVKTKANSITFLWSREKAEDSGGPVLCSTDQTGKSLLEIRLASAPLR